MFNLFNIGDKVVYPMHGAGVIVSIEEKRILNENHQYYVLKMPVGDMKVMLPIDNVDEIGVREIVDGKEAESVIKLFNECGEDDNNNWNKRYRDNIEKLKSGDLRKVAWVTKTLLLRDKKKSLSNAERKMLNNSKNILISELVLSMGKTYQEIEDILLGAV